MTFVLKYNIFCLQPSFLSASHIRLFFYVFYFFLNCLRSAGYPPISPRRLEEKVIDCQLPWLRFIAKQTKRDVQQWFVSSFG